MSGVAQLFEPGLDRGAIEKMLLAAAVHGSGARFWRAHLLVWNPDRGSLEGRLSWLGGRRRGGLAEALASARRSPPEGEVEGTRRLRALRIPPERLGEGLRRIWTAGIHGVLEVPASASYPWEGTIGAVALHGGARPFGLLVGEWGEERPAEEGAPALEALRRIGDGALSAFALAESARRRALQMAAIAEVVRAGTASVNLAEVTSLLVQAVCKGTAARGAVLWRAVEGGDLGLVSSYGPAGARERLSRGLQPLASAAMEEGRPLSVERAVDARRLTPDVAAQVSTVAVVPVGAYGRIRGALAAYDRAAHHPNDSMRFEAADLEFLGVLADQCGALFEQALLQDERKRADQARRDLVHRLGRSDRLAAVGEMSMRMAREARNPLASIGAFARRVHRTLDESDPSREYLEVVVREAERLERCFADALRVTPTERPRLQTESVNSVVQKALQQMGERLVRRRVRLLKKLSPDLPPLVLDAERLEGVFLNILGHTLDRVTPGGRVRVESRRVQGYVVVDVADDAACSPGERLADLFVPFALRGDGGPDVGLALARQVVWEHGGEVRVRSSAEWATIFSVTLPVAGNENRRHPGSDRRAAHGDRRQRFPADG